MEATNILRIDARNPGLTPKVWAVQFDSGRLIRCYIAGTTGSVSKAGFIAENQAEKKPIRKELL